MSWLFITHDIGVVRAIADDVIVLYAGRIMEKGPMVEVLRSPLHPYTRDLLASVPTVKQEPVSALTDGISKVADKSVPGRHGCVYSL